MAGFAGILLAGECTAPDSRTSHVGRIERMRYCLAHRIAAVFCLMLPTLAVVRLSVSADAPIDRGIGGRVANFTLDDPAGKPISLSEFRGKKALVMVFLGTDCPVGNLYAPRLAELSRQYD